jgi:predicted metal-dependent phosphoesterase TrpH
LIKLRIISSKFDLHCHSTYSDGVLRPDELVRRAARRGVSVLALTDHDETGGVAEAHRLAAGEGVEIVNGVEISVTWNGQTLHIVGLHIDPAHPELATGLNSLREGRRRRAEQIADELDKAGVEGSLAGARAHATNPELVGRTHFARFLAERGHARDVNSVFRKFLVYGKPGHVPHLWAGLEQAVGWIRASGGMAVLAHPGRYKLEEPQRCALLAAFKEAGGAAIEVVTGSHTPAQFQSYARYAQHYGLLASAGSDFHGPGESYRDLGELPDLPRGCRPVWAAW